MLIDIWKNIVEKQNNDTEELANLFIAARTMPNPPLWDMVKPVLDKITDKLGEVDLTPLKISCKAADKVSKNAYHNEHHNREVTLLTSLLVLKHLNEGNKAGFKARDARNLIMAASIHDLGHDGGSNTVGGVYFPMRLEKQSVKLAVKLWQGMDVTNKDLDFIKTCVATTDVSCPKDGVSPRSKLVKSFNKVSAKPNLAREAAAMLSDADLAISGALSYDLFEANSMLVEEETAGAVPFNKGSAKFFLGNIMDSFPLSGSGRNYLGNSYNNIKKWVFEG